LCDQICAVFATDVGRALVSPWVELRADPVKKKFRSDMARPLRSSERKIKELDRENAKLVSEIKKIKGL
jgi:hypothetical protein